MIFIYYLKVKEGTLLDEVGSQVTNIASKVRYIFIFLISFLIFFFYQKRALNENLKIPLKNFF